MLLSIKYRTISGDFFYKYRRSRNEQKNIRKKGKKGLATFLSSLKAFRLEEHLMQVS